MLATFGGINAVPSTGTTTLRREAQKKDILVGSGAINPNYLNDSSFGVVLAEQFNSLSPENELKWSFVNPSEGVYNFEPLDRLVDFAEANEMVVKGDGLISSCCNPDYLLNITDRTTLQNAMKNHFEAVMQRYTGKMDRWDVVTEALKTMGGGLNLNYFYNISGPTYIEDAFRFARKADPYAKLFINDNLVESIPQK